MKMTQDEIRHVARLANLPLSEAEVSTYADHLSKILEYIGKLNELDTKGVTPTYNVTGLTDIWAEDITRPSLPQEDALENAKDTKDGYFVTKGVFEE